MKSIGREKLYSSPRIYLGWPTVAFPSFKLMDGLEIPFRWFNILKLYN
jgi:hypothetical protein